jgi:hypothetical protein
VPGALALLLAVAAAAQPAAPAGASPAMAAPGGPIGLVVTAGVGGGVSAGASSRYTQTGVFEAEVAAGWELPFGLRPELAFAAGIAPRGSVAVRPGLHLGFAELPLYARAALDLSTATGAWSFHWLLLGGGGEVRFTDLLGVFVEADLGIPLERAVGLGLLLRGGMSFSF